MQTWQRIEPRSHEALDASLRALGWLAFRIGTRVRRAGLLAAMGLVIAAIYLAAVALRFEGMWEPTTTEFVKLTLPLVVVVKLLAIVGRGSHRGWLHRATFADVVAQVEAASLGTLGVAAISYGLQLQPMVPRLVLLLDWCMTVLFFCGLRGLLRLVRERYAPLLRAGRLSKVLVVSTGDAGIEVVKMIQAQPRLGIRVVGLIDVTPGVWSRGQRIAGVPVLGGVQELEAIVARTGAQRVLIPTPAVPPRRIRALIDVCNRTGVRAQVVPGIDALLVGNLTVRPRDVAIEDLLRRPPVRMLDESIEALLRDRVVLVTGGAGSIGSEIARQALVAGPSRLVLLDTHENGLFQIQNELAPRAEQLGAELSICVGSVCDPGLLDRLFREVRPAVVVHAAAHKHVPMMEANPGAAVKNNALGTRCLVDQVVRSGAEAFVLISTDKAVRPTSVMGATKRLAEMYVQSLAGLVSTRLVAVRFGNVLGSNGSVVPTFREQIQRGGPVTVTHPEMTRFFMTIREASQLVLQAAGLGRGGEIFVLDMGQPVRILDLARDMIRLSGLEIGREVDIVFTGLRPGEKLFEELHDEDEPLLPTPSEKLSVVRADPPDFHEVADVLNRLAELVDGPPGPILRLLAEVVPGYRCKVAKHLPAPVFAGLDTEAAHLGLRAPLDQGSGAP